MVDAHLLDSRLAPAASGENNFDLTQNTRAYGCLRMAGHRPPSVDSGIARLGLQPSHVIHDPSHTACKGTSIYIHSGQWTVIRHISAQTTPNPVLSPRCSRKNALHSREMTGRSITPAITPDTSVVVVWAQPYMYPPGSARCVVTCPETTPFRAHWVPCDARGTYPGTLAPRPPGS